MDDLRFDIRLYSGRKDDEKYTYRTELCSSDYDNLDEMLEELARELKDDAERLMEGQNDSE